MKFRYLLTAFIAAATLHCSAQDGYYIDVECENPPAVVQAGEPFEVTLRLRDMARFEQVTSFDVVFTPEGGTPVSVPVTVDEPLDAKRRVITVGGIVCDITGFNIPVTYNVANINGTDRPQLGDYVSATLTSAENIFPTTVVFEEATGTWCQFCYDAFLAMEHMHETYGDKGFAGLAYHVDDIFSTSFTSDFAGKISGGYPKGAWNRNYSRVVKPTQSGLEGYYLSEVATPSIVGIDVSVKYPEDDDNAIDIEASALFGLAFENSGYSVSYMLTEDGIPSTQNTPSGYKAVVYNDIVRAGSVYKPEHLDMIPATVSTTDRYSFGTRLPLTSVNDRKKCNVTVMLIDDATGTVAAARRTSLNPSGIEGVAEGIPAQDLQATYYDLQGRPADASRPGIYIRRQGDRAEKVIIR